MREVAFFLAYYGGAGYGLLSPLFGTLLFVHMLILRPEYLVWGNPIFGRLHLFTFVCAAIGYLIRRGSIEPALPDQWMRRGLAIFGAFVLWTIIVSLNAAYSVEVSLNKSVELGKIWLLCFLLSRLLSETKHVSIYVSVVGWSSALVGGWGIVQGLAGNPRLDELSPGGSNYLAAQLALVAPMCLAAGLEVGRGWPYRVAHIASTIVTSTCVLYTGSRGGIVGTAAGLAFLAAVASRRVFVKFVVVGALGALVVLPFLPETMDERIASIFAENLDDSAASRRVLWELAFRIWQDSPVTGVGLHNFSAAKEQFADSVSPLPWGVGQLIFGRDRMPHSMYMGLLAEAGLVGIGLFGWMLARTILARSRSAAGRSEAHQGLVLISVGIRAGLAGFAVAAVFGDFEFIELLYTQVVLVGVVLGIIRREVGEAEVAPQRDESRAGPQGGALPRRSM
jgi:O-antigen ligase